jgi:hypothetical protein
MAASALIPAIAEPPASRATARRAGETARPAHPLQVVQAVCIGAEPGLELAGPRQSRRQHCMIVCSGLLGWRAW